MYGANVVINVPVPSWLKWWKRLEREMDLSADAFESLSKQLRKNTKQLLKADQHAQLNRYTDSSIMDMHDRSTAKHEDLVLTFELHANGWIAPSGADIQVKLLSEERKDGSTYGQSSWIASGIKIQDVKVLWPYCQTRSVGTAGGPHDHLPPARRQRHHPITKGTQRSCL